MSKRFLVSLLLSVSCALLLAACGGPETPTTNSTNVTVANQTATTTSTPAATTSTPAATTSSPSTTTASGSGDKIGVAECDAYLAKYEECVSSKIPQAARASYASTLERTRKQWQQVAATPQGRETLAAACKLATDQSRQTMKTYGCDF